MQCCLSTFMAWYSRRVCFCTSPQMGGTETGFYRRFKLNGGSIFVPIPLLLKILIMYKIYRNLGGFWIKFLIVSSCSMLHSRGHFTAPDLTVRDFCLWGHLKAHVFSTPILNLLTFKRGIQAEISKILKEMLQKVYKNTLVHFRSCTEWWTSSLQCYLKKN